MITRRQCSWDDQHGNNEHLCTQSNDVRSKHMIHCGQCPTLSNKLCYVSCYWCILRTTTSCQIVSQHTDHTIPPKWPYTKFSQSDIQLALDSDNLAVLTLLDMSAVFDNVTRAAVHHISWPTRHSICDPAQNLAVAATICDDVATDDFVHKSDMSLVYCFIIIIIIVIIRPIIVVVYFSLSLPYGEQRLWICNTLGNETFRLP